MNTLELYFEWLANKTQLDLEGPDGYSQLCRELFKAPFQADIVAMDEHRIHDALEMRIEWAESQTNDPDARFDIVEQLDGMADPSLEGTSCSYLELLVILAEKISYETLGGPYQASVGKWMREMLANCGWDRFTDGYFEENDEEETKDKIHGIARKLTARAYGWDGDGGLFPLMYPQRDQRRIELMDQMYDYLADNYDI